MEEIIKELSESVKWIPEVERRSKWYASYLDRINVDLKEELYNQSDKYLNITTDN